MPVSTELVPAHYHDQAYLETMLGPIRVCARYRPKLGQGGRRNVADAESGVTAEQFLALYGADPFYHWIGLDNPLMYAAHKAAGGMTSIYRQIGIGSERLFKSVLKDRLGLSSEDVKKGLFPCVLIMSAQIDQDLVDRYRNGGWAILTGTEGRNDPIRSTYDFVREVVGYDLAGFFKRNSDTLRIEMAKVLKALLEAKTT